MGSRHGMLLASGDARRYCSGPAICLPSTHTRFLFLYLILPFSLYFCLALLLLGCISISIYISAVSYTVCCYFTRARIAGWCLRWRRWWREWRRTRVIGRIGIHPGANKGPPYWCAVYWEELTEFFSGLRSFWRTISWIFLFLIHPTKLVPIHRYSERPTTDPETIPTPWYS